MEDISDQISDVSLSRDRLLQGLQTAEGGVSNAGKEGKRVLIDQELKSLEDEKDQLSAERDAVKVGQ